MKFLSSFLEQVTSNKSSVIKGQCASPSPNEESAELTQQPAKGCGCLAQYKRPKVTIIMIPKFHKITLIIWSGFGNILMLTII